jgi:DNA-binding transcriptional ArsR family regulator
MIRSNDDADDAYDPFAEDQVAAPAPLPSMTPATSRKPPRTMLTHPFLRGPVDLHWLGMATDAGVAAIRVGLAVWYAAGVRKSLTITLTETWRAPLGLSRFQVSRGLRQLEEAGLITIEPRDGKAPHVTIRCLPEGFTLS